MTRSTLFSRAAAALLLLACGEPRLDDRADVTASPPTPATPAPPPAVRAPDGDALEYTLRFPSAANHYVEVEATLPTGGEKTLDLMMAVWTPGSYLVREYSRHVEQLEAMTLGGEPLVIDKTAKNRWRVETDGEARIGLRYRVYARELSVRTNYITSDIAVLNGAPTFITIANELDRPHDVALELAEGWTGVVTGLPPEGDSGTRFLAADYDELADSPIVAGTPVTNEFTVDGAVYTLADFGGGAIWDSARAVADLEQLVRAQVAFWGSAPFSRYVFINVLYGSGRNGLEHKTSTLLTASAWSARKRESYRGWLGLASHELFHVWNVKHLRPAELGPFDYEAENYTRSLWIVEGITSYYDDLLLARAGLLEHDDYLERLSKNIKRLQTTPGRAVQSLATSSFDAWIKYYRSDENTDNTAVSYYTKGAVVGWLLDMAIRRASGGRGSLDDVMRLAYTRYSGERGFTVEQFRATVDEVAGESLAEFFARYVDGTEELDYQPALAWVGLELAAPKPADDEPGGWLGASLRGNEVTKVLRDTPAYAAGLNVEDEVLATDGWRVASGKLDERLERYRPGDTVDLLIARRGRIQSLPVVLGAPPRVRWTLERAERPTATQRARLAAWLDPPS